MRVGFSCVIVWFSLPLFLLGSSAQAARPMITDDGRVVDSKACQVESWVQFYRDSTEAWALPGCNIAKRLELTLGGAVTHRDGSTQATDVLFQGKTLFKLLEPNGWSLGLVVGGIHHPDTREGRRRIGDLYTYMPLSFSFLDDRVVVHGNVGFMRESEPVSYRVTWGVGSETGLSPRIWVISEAFGSNSDRLFFQGGLRLWLVLDRVQVDTTYGNRFGSVVGERWLSVGLRLLSPSFLP